MVYVTRTNHPVELLSHNIHVPSADKCGSCCRAYMLLANQLSAGAMARRRLRVATASAQKLTVLQRMPKHGTSGVCQEHFWGDNSLRGCSIGISKSNFKQCRECAAPGGASIMIHPTSSSSANLTVET
jgi:hypothetical protein